MVKLPSAAAVAAFIMVCSNCVEAQTVYKSTANATTIRVNGQNIRQAVMVPLRDVIASIGGKITWDPDTRTVDVVHAGARAELTIGSRAATVDGNGIWLSAAPVTRYGMTMVPAEFISQAFGGVVTRDVRTNVVSIAMPNGAAQVAVAEVEAPAARVYRTPVVRAYRRVLGRGSVPARIIEDPEYAAFLRDQDYQRYLADRVSWIRDYQNYRENYPLSASEAKAGMDARYMAYLRFGDDVLYDSDQFAWQQNYSRFLRQRKLQSASVQAFRMDDYLRDRASLMKETDRLVR